MVQVQYRWKGKTVPLVGAVSCEVTAYRILAFWHFRRERAVNICVRGCAWRHTRREHTHALRAFSLPLVVRYFVPGTSVVIRGRRGAGCTADGY